MKRDVKEKRTFHFFHILLAICTMIFAVSCGRSSGVPKEFEGKYLWTNGYGWTEVVLSSNKSYEYTVGGCVGEFIKKSGKYDCIDGRIIIAFVWKNELDKSLNAEYLEFYLLKWGRRHLLVPREQMELYCCAVAAPVDEKYLDTSRLFLIKSDEVEDSSTGIGIIPSDWSDHYDKLVKIKPNEIQVLKGEIPVPYLWLDYYLWLKNNSPEEKYQKLKIDKKQNKY